MISGHLFINLLFVFFLIVYSRVDSTDNAKKKDCDSVKYNTYHEGRAISLFNTRGDVFETHILKSRQWRLHVRKPNLCVYTKPSVFVLFSIYNLFLECKPKRLERLLQCNSVAECKLIFVRAFSYRIALMILGETRGHKEAGSSDGLN